jgi:hypothetical protein
MASAYLEFLAEVIWLVEMVSLVFGSVCFFLC